MFKNKASNTFCFIKRRRKTVLVELSVIANVHLYHEIANISEYHNSKFTFCCCFSILLEGKALIPWLSTDQHKWEKCVTNLAMACAAVEVTWKAGILAVGTHCIRGHVPFIGLSKRSYKWPLQYMRTCNSKKKIPSWQ